MDGKAPMRKGRKRTSTCHNWFEIYPTEDQERAQSCFRLYMENWFNQAFASMGFPPERKGSNVIPFDKHRKPTRCK